MRRHLVGIGMRGVDHRFDGFVAQEAHEPLDAAEAAGARGDRLRPGRGRAAGQRQRSARAADRRRRCGRAPRLPSCRRGSGRALQGHGVSSNRPQRWLSIIGIGEDGVDGLSPVARRLVADAELVVGGKRHLALADALIRGQRLAWPSPIGDVAAGNREASRPAGGRAGERRSLPLWRRRSADALDSGRRDALPAAALVPSAWRRRGSAGRCRT